MTTDNTKVVTMGDRCPESECYQCGRLKTALSYRSLCLTYETQRADANADENDELRTRLSDYEELADRLKEALARCRYQASCQIGGEDALRAQLNKIRGVVNEALGNQGGQP